MTEIKFTLPAENLVTIYSKSGCKNCSLVKSFLKEKNVLFTVIECDEFILEMKDEFLKFIEELVGNEYRSFPMVFDGKVFIGGLKETIVYIEKILDFEITF